jgi:hypothetical protein
MPRRARPDPESIVAEQARVDQNVLDLREWKGRHCPRVEARDLAHALGPGHSRLRTPRRVRDLPRVGAVVAWHEREDAPPVALEDEGLDDLSECASDRAGGVLRGRRPLGEFLDPCFGSGRAQEGGNELDRRRPPGA